jgi:hypothetical protein
VEAEPDAIEKMREVLGMPAQAPAPGEGAPKSADRAFLQSIVEASPEEILAMGDLGEKLEQAYTRNADDKEIETLFMAVANAYTQAELSTLSAEGA